jgi:hypothetical protein
VRGYTSPPGVLVTERDAYYVVEDSKTGGPAICSAEALFQDAGFSGFAMDQLLTAPSGADFAPHFYVEGRLNAFDDVERKKRIQLLMAQYSFYGNNLDNKNPVPGGGNVGSGSVLGGGGGGGGPTVSDGGGGGGGNKDAGKTIISKLGVDVVKDMGGTTKAVALRPVTTDDISNPVVWVNKRNRFGGVRSGLVGIRFYTMSDSPPCYVVIGPWSYGLKSMRVGRA